MLYSSKSEQDNKFKNRSLDNDNNIQKGVNDANEKLDELAKHVVNGTVRSPELVFRISESTKKKLIISSICILMSVILILLIIFIPRIARTVDNGGTLDKPNLDELFSEFNAFKATFKPTDETNDLIPNFKITQFQYDNNGYRTYEDIEFKSINRFVSFDNNAYWRGYTDDFYTDTYLDDTLGGQHHQISNQSLVPLGQYIDSIQRIFAPQYFKQSSWGEASIGDDKWIVKEYKVPDDMLHEYSIKALGYEAYEARLTFSNYFHYEYDIFVKDVGGSTTEYRVELNTLKDIVLPAP